MIKDKECKWRDGAVEFLNHLQSLGYDLHYDIIGITQDIYNFTVFYKYLGDFGY